MGDALTAAKKFKRALRNETGAKFKLEELRAFADAGVLDIIQRIEAEELKAGWLAKPLPTSSETGGSTSDGTGGRRTSGRSPAMTPALDRSAIAALVAGI